MIVAWQAVAKTKLPAAPQVWDPRILWTTLALAGIIVLGAVAIALLDRWRKRAIPTTCDVNEQLAQFRELYDKGELSQDEFERIRARLSEQLRQEMNLLAPAPPTDFKDETPAKDGQAGQAPPAGSLTDRAGGQELPPSP